MKRTRVLSTLAAIAAGFGLQAQSIGNATAPANNQLAFYHPLTLAPTEAEPTGGEGGKSDESNEALAKEAQNPVAKLISIPFQNNFNFGADWQLRFQFQLLLPKSIL